MSSRSSEESIILPAHSGLTLEACAKGNLTQGGRWLVSPRSEPLTPEG